VPSIDDVTLGAFEHIIRPESHRGVKHVSSLRPDSGTKLIEFAYQPEKQRIRLVNSGVGEVWTPVDEDSVKSPTPSRVPVIGRKFQFSNLQFPKFLETLEAGGDTTCALDGIDDDDLNAIWRILRQNWSESE